MALRVGDFVIGRSSSCDLSLAGGLISRQHAQLTVDADGLTIVDLGSRNGVRVNDVCIDGPTALQHGDKIAVGFEALTVVDEALLNRSERLSTLPPKSDSGLGDEQETMVARVNKLSKREFEVFGLISQGHTQREVARRLNISVKTVEKHRTHIGAKLDCRTRAELMRYAVVSGMLRNLGEPPRP